MRRLFLILALLLAPAAAFGQARIDQLGAAATPTDATVVPVCEGCGAAVNAVGATGTQLTLYFATKFFSIANNLSEVSNKSTSRINLGIPAGTTTTLLHGNAAGDPTMAAVATGDIAASAVTYAKIQNSTAGSRLFCVSGGAAAAWGECTLSARLAFAGSVLDIVSSSIGSAQLTAGAAATNVGSLGADLGGTLPSPNVLKVNGVTYNSAPAVHQVAVVTSAAGGGSTTYKTISDCVDTAGNHLNYAISTDTFACGTSNGVSLTAGKGMAISPTPYVNGAGVISPNFPINQTCKVANYTVVEADSATSLCMNGTSLTLALPSSSVSMLPPGEGFTVTNTNASALTVCIGTAGACSGGGSSTFKNSPGTTTSFTLTQNAWAIIQSDGNGSPNNYWVFPSGAGGGGGGSGAFTKITSVTASNSTSIDFTGLNNTYDHLVFDCRNIVLATNSVALWARVGIGSTTWQASQYEWRYDSYNVTTTTVSSANNTTDAQMVLTPTDVASGVAANSIYIDMYAPGVVVGSGVNIMANTQYVNTTTDETSSRLAGTTWYGNLGTNAVTGLRLLASSGNITSGTCTEYGVTK